LIEILDQTIYAGSHIPLPSAHCIILQKILVTLAQQQDSHISSQGSLDDRVGTFIKQVEEQRDFIIV
jgi:hypothetical protein